MTTKTKDYRQGGGILPPCGAGSTTTAVWRCGHRRPWATAAAPSGTPPPGYSRRIPLGDDSLTAMEAGNALEPVVLRAMERAGWLVMPADLTGPAAGDGEYRPPQTVTGHPDGTGRMPLPGIGRPLGGGQAPKFRCSSSRTTDTQYAYGDLMDRRGEDDEGRRRSSAG